MYVTSVPNRNSPPAILLRESYREGKKVKTRTLANLTSWTPEKIETLKRTLKGEALVSVDEAFKIVRSLPHGHVAAVRGVLRQLGVHKLLGARRSRQRDLVEAMLVSRVIDPRSKLATCRGLDSATAFSSLGEELGIDDADVHELYDALDWLLTRQAPIEKKLAAAHLKNGGTALYDLSATYLEGRTCPLAKLGYPRGSKKGKLQINFGLLTNADGCPVAVQVYHGNVADPSTVADQVAKLRDDFLLDEVVLVGDRGMLTSARLREDLEPNGVQWITSLRAPQIRKLATAGAFQMSLFDDKDLAEVTHPSFPSERLILCKNPLLQAERERKRNAMLDATERKLQELLEATQRQNRPFRGKDKIGIRIGRILERTKMGKHFNLNIEDDCFTYQRDLENIEREAALDGIYIIRTNASSEKLDAEQVVRTYKSLQKVERAFRSLKTAQLHVRPVHHRAENRVRAHIFLCMLAYYIQWHMRAKLAPILFDDDDAAAANSKSRSIVAPAERSDSALSKAATKNNSEGLPVHSFKTLLADLATISKNSVTSQESSLEFQRITTPTPLQVSALELLNVSL